MSTDWILQYAKSVDWLKGFQAFKKSELRSQLTVPLKMDVKYILSYSFLVFLDIHRHTKQQKISNAMMHFWNNPIYPLLSTVSRTWTEPEICHLVALSKHFKRSNLAPNFFESHTWVKKCHFGNFSETDGMAVHHKLRSF